MLGDKQRREHAYYVTLLLSCLSWSRPEALPRRVFIINATLLLLVLSNVISLSSCQYLQFVIKHMSEYQVPFGEKKE